MNLETTHLILVDKQDNEIGIMEKLEAHKKGLLHRAFSIFIFNSKGELLIQQRAFDKYHSQGLWTNTCCSHPYPNESNEQATSRRLKEEMGISSPLKFIFSFIYTAELENDLIEHELDHVYAGISDVIPTLNIQEAIDYKYISLSHLEKSIELEPEIYTYWFKHIINNNLNELHQFLNHENL